MAEEQRRDAVIEFPNVRLTAGGKLRSARESAGLSLAEMAGQTKIPVRMLTLIEAGDFAALPAKAYATGFSRTYARALGLDEGEILADVRRELGQADPAETRLAPTFEPGDPARVPTARFAWLAAVAALAVLAAGLLLWRSYYAPAVTLPPLAEPQLPAPVQPPAPAASVVVPLPAPSAGVPAAAPVLTTSAAPASAGAVPALPASAAPRPRHTGPAVHAATPASSAATPSGAGTVAAPASQAAAAPSPAASSSPTSTAQ